MNQIIVFSGGPFSGKTTTLNAFKKNGYTVIKEAALSVIDELIEEIGSEEQRQFVMKNPNEFQVKIFKKQLENEEKALTENHKENLIFLDRSVIDGFAYLHFNKQNWDEEHFQFKPQHSYDTIFLFDTLSHFDNRKNSGRIETGIEESLAIKNSLLFTYKFFGYKPLMIFEKKIEERIEDIKNQINI